jgi:hypothetical protein
MIVGQAQPRKHEHSANARTSRGLKLSASMPTVYRPCPFGIQTRIDRLHLLLAATVLT